MFSGGRLRELVRERLIAAAEEIITEFELITNQYEEEIDRQRRLLNMHWCSQIKSHRIDFSQQPECKAEEVVTEQQLWNQKRNSVLDQEEPEAPQVKEEQEELCISQEGEQLVVKLEADPFTVTLVCEEKQQSEAEPNNASQLRDCQEEEVLTVQQLCNRKRNSSLDQVDQDAAQAEARFITS
ncbi:uncharacterized protein KZ484_012073 [Pholidichthys leucotaenia]